MDKGQLRKQIRRQRRDVEQGELESRSASICQRLSQTPWIRAAHHIALYIPNDGEPDVTGLVHHLPIKNRCFYLPCLDSLERQHMVFRRWNLEDWLVNNKFGIPEPQKSKVMPTWALSVVLVPLVAFDRQGNRLGMGAGYYDRALYMRRGNSQLMPRLIGIAHDFQEVPQLTPNPWDVGMDMIITEERTIEPD